MKSALYLALVCGAMQLLPCNAQATFQLRKSGSLDTTATVAPGGVLTLDVVAVSISAEVDVQANLDSFTYRINFPNPLFNLQNNVFAAPFDNNVIPGGFNGSIPWWSGTDINILPNVDAGSPGATPLVSDLYRTTATTTGVPVVGPDSLLETLTLQVPAAPGNYSISLNVLEAADRNGALHTTSNGTDFIVTVGGPCNPDITPPTITLNGINPVTVECHAAFVDAGATASDNCPPGTAPVSSSGVVDANTPGSYTITYSAIDASGNPATATRTVNVVDTAAPVITLNGANPLAVECHTAFADPGATAADLCAGSVAVSSSGAVNANVPGSYTITYSATDPSGNTGTATRTVNVVDTAAPVITLNGANPLSVECHSAFADPGATATDLCAGSVAVSSSGAVNANTPGSYTITYSATDPSGNTATATRTVNVVDTTAPVITLNGANPLTVPCRTPFTDPGATASDTCAGIVAPVGVSGSVDVNTAGNYTLTYTATDPTGNTATSTRTVTVAECPPFFLTCPSDLAVPNDAGICKASVIYPDPISTGGVGAITIVCNPPSGSAFELGATTVNCSATDTTAQTATCSFTVTVKDTEAPVITLNGASPLTLECHAAFADPGATATDLCAGSVAVSSSGAVDANTPGSYTITYSATDPSGNTATATRTVNVVDTTAPVITLNGANPLTVPCRTPFTDPGATASDTCAGIVAPVGVSGSVDVNTAGNYTLTYTATDPSGNTGTATRTVTVAQCGAFVLACPPAVTVPNDAGLCSAIVNYATPVASGGVGSVTIVCNPPSGSVFPVGATTVNCIATDSTRQTAPCSFTVTVKDADAPNMTCPPDLTVDCLSNVPPADFGDGSASDNCDPAPVVTHVGDVAVGSNPTIITRTYQATDANGNTATCDQTFTVQGIVGDFNGDCCVDRQDLDVLLSQIRARSTDLTYDVNGDGKLDIADARTLVLLFTNPGGAPCSP